MYRDQPAHRDQFVCTVHANIPLCREHYRLILTLPEFPTTEPGQFIQLSCCDLEEDYNVDRELDWPADAPPTLGGRELIAPLTMLRRPFSLAGRRDTSSGVELDIIHRVVGVGTDWLSHLKPGDRTYILGPLGNRFTLPPAEGLAILVGGGVGIPPMLYLAERLANQRAVAFCGALGRDLLPLTINPKASLPTANSFDPIHNIEEFSRHGIPSVITTDDGSYGFRGFVTQALECFLDQEGFSIRGSGTKKTEARSQEARTHPQRSELKPELRTLNPSFPIIYTCGPEPMMKRVADIAASRGLPCQIAVERAMACGMGTCQSCCIKVRKPIHLPPLVGKDWAYRLACTDGPVFLGADLLW